MVPGFATLVGTHAIRLPYGTITRPNTCMHKPATHSVIRMAGGVPKVPYKAPGAQSHEFIDIFNRLYRERIIYVGQDLDDESANQIIAVLLYLENDDAKANVSMYFNCPGGTIPAGLAVYDCMRAMKYPVVTLNLGLAASMSAFLVAAGTKGKRMALPNSRFLLQSPSLLDTVRGQASDVAIEVRNILNQRNRIIDGLNQFTGRSTDQLKKDLSRDMYLTAPEARTYGLIDNVLMPQVKGPSESFVAGLGSPIRMS
ncbi:unnamed protein product [Agarophyton chilense]